MMISVDEILEDIERGKAVAARYFQVGPTVVGTHLGEMLKKHYGGKLPDHIIVAKRFPMGERE